METNTAGTTDGTADESARLTDDRKWPRSARLLVAVALLALYYPQLVPPSVTLYSAGASRDTLAFLVIAISIFLPGTIAYHVYSNWVFRGRQPLDGAAVPAGRPTARPAVPGPRPVEGGN